MSAPTSVPVIHYYDPVAHGIVCGVGAADNRSTKHSRNVTCAACVALLAERAPADAGPAGDPGDPPGAATP
jgi:hypothetical protein